jgi:hypothetical protein
MTAEDRTEVRTMLTDILAGPLEKINGQIKLVNSQLTDINVQTTKTNGTVTRHERLILENLPHTIVHCVQTKAIDQLREELIRGGTIKSKENRDKDDLRKNKEERTMTGMRRSTKN